MLTTSIHLMKPEQRNDYMSKGNFLKVSCLEPYHEGRVVTAQECRSKRTKFALIQPIFDECLLSEKHTQCVSPLLYSSS